MLTEQLLDSPSHFLRGFGVYCRDNGIPESEVLRGLQKAAAAFPQAAVEFRKLAVTPPGALGALGGSVDEITAAGSNLLDDGVKPGFFSGLGKVFSKPKSPVAKPITPITPITPVNGNPSTAGTVVTPSSGGLTPKPAVTGGVFAEPYVAPIPADPVSSPKLMLAREGTPLSGPTIAKPTPAVTETKLPNPFDSDSIEAYQRTVDTGIDASIGYRQGQQSLSRRSVDQTPTLSLKPGPVSSPTPYEMPQPPRPQSGSWFARKLPETDEQYVAKLQAKLTGSADGAVPPVSPSTRIPTSVTESPIPFNADSLAPVSLSYTDDAAKLQKFMRGNMPYRPATDDAAKLQKFMRRDMPYRLATDDSAKIQKFMRGNMPESASLADGAVPPVSPSTRIPQTVVDDVPLAQPAAAPAPAAAASGAADEAAGAAQPAPAAAATGAADEAAEVAEAAVAAQPASGGAVSPRSWYQATKDGLGQVRDIAIGGTAGQRALTAGSGAVGAGVGGYVESQDPDSNWLDTTSAAIHGGLRGLLYSRLGTGSFNAAKNFGAGTASSLATAAGSVAGSVLTDSQLGGHVDKSVDYPFRPAYRYLDGHPGLSDPGVNLKPGHKGSIADLHDRYAQSGQALTDQAENPSWNQDPSRLGENRTKLDARYAQELEAKKLDPTMSQVANAVNTPAFSGNMTKPQETADYLKLNGKPGQDSFRAVLVSMESRLQAAGPDGLKDPQNQKLALDYVNGQLALTSAAGGKDVEALKASATNALKDGVISQEELGGFLQTDAGKDAFKEYSKQFFGPDGPTADPSTILSNFVGIMKAKPYQAAALMIGIPVAMFGVMSALGGEGGMGALLATVLGGGAAAYGAGMFGGEGVSRLFGAATAPAGADQPATQISGGAYVPDFGQDGGKNLQMARSPGQEQEAVVSLVKHISPGASLLYNEAEMLEQAKLQGLTPELLKTVADIYTTQGPDEARDAVDSILPASMPPAKRVTTLKAIEQWAKL